jgi:uncharacterized protein
MSRRATLLALIVLHALPGCSILKPQPDPSRFYVLTASVDAPAAPSEASGLTLGLGPIKLPDYLDRAPIVTRVAPNQVVFSDFERWAEPLERNVGRVLGEDLSRLLNTERVISLPAFVPIAVRFEIPVEVLRFESDDKGVVELWARWAIRDPNTRQLLHTSESHIIEAASGTETQAVVAALSRAVGKLGEEIAAEVRRLAAKP